MKEIFKRIEGREWDWFGSSEKGCYEINEFSLADLLVNKSWCQAVWGEAEPLTDNDDVYWNGSQKCLHCGVDPRYQPPRESGCNHAHYPEACKECNKRSTSWNIFSNEAFKILQQQGQEACINYITKTMR